MHTISEHIHEQIKLSMDKIQRKFKPKHIYLFGSYALGNVNSESDLDLCVIVNLRNQRKIDLIRNIRSEINNSLDLPLDILVYDVEEFNERAKHKNTFEYKISKQGRLINE